MDIQENIQASIHYDKVMSPQKKGGVPMVYKDIDSMPLVITVVDIADTLAIGRCKAYSLVNSGKIKSLKIGCTYRIPREAFVEYLNGINETEVK